MLHSPTAAARPAERGEDAEPAAPDARRGRLAGPASRIPGLALAVAIAAAATVAGGLVPLVGAPVSGIVLGILVGLALRRTRLSPASATLAPGIRTASGFVLQLSVVVLGARLSLAQVVAVGLGALPVMLGTLAICLTGAWLIGRALGVVGNLRTLIGVGSGICGASAIAAVTPVIGAVGAEVAYAVSTIFLFNIAAVLLFPFVGHLLGLGQHAFGLFAGTAINDTSSVVAAATTYGAAATDTAVVVKLARTLMIIPISLGLGALAARRERVGTAGAARADAVAGTPGTVADAPPARRRRPPLTRLVPWFLVGFVLVAGLNSLGAIPAAWSPALGAASTFLITTALAAIGLSTDLGGFRRAGAKPLLLGGSLWVLLACSSLGLQWLTGAL